MPLRTVPAGRAKLALEDGVRVRAGDCVHRVESDPKSPRDRGPKRGKIENLAHQLDVIGDGIDHLDAAVADAADADAGEVHVRRIEAQNLGNLLRLGIDGVRDFLRRRPAIRGVELDAEIAVRPAGVMARGEDDAAEGLVLADDAGCGGGRENAARADEKAADAVRRRDADHGLDRFRIVVASVAADNERHAAEPLRRADGVEHRLREVREVIACRELCDLLAQAAGAGLHARDRVGRNAIQCHEVRAPGCRFKLNNPRRPALPSVHTAHSRPLLAIETGTPFHWMRQPRGASAKIPSACGSRTIKVAN